ncbi:MAG: NADH-quinone oxidoreductase subunit J [Desulfuromonadales bacterium]|nr:NADH-quinone oxidoreductase subunit J [Desulfuromonadales bacterium]
METFFFMIVAAVAVLTGILVVLCKNPINSALSLVATFFCLATLYIMLEAPFMAAIQVMVYAGAIMVLLVFVIMLLNLRTEIGRRSTHTLFVGGIAGVLFLIQLLYVLRNSVLTGTKGPIDSAMITRVGHTELVGTALFTDFLLPFEITSILLLAAIVGAVVLAKKKV